MATCTLTCRAVGLERHTDSKQILAAVKQIERKQDGKKWTTTMLQHSSTHCTVCVTLIVAAVSSLPAGGVSKPVVARLHLNVVYTENDLGLVARLGAGQSVQLQMD